MRDQEFPIGLKLEANKYLFLIKSTQRYEMLLLLKPWLQS